MFGLSCTTLLKLIGKIHNTPGDWYIMQSSGGAKGTDMLTHVRAVLSILKFRGHPDLQSTVVSKAQNYWLKITGASEMQHEPGCEGVHDQRPGALASTRAGQEPGDMVYKYWQSSLLEKIGATSNF